MKSKENRSRYIEGKRFVNPYNFIPFEGECNRNPLKPVEHGGLTGYFQCSMELLTPLFIPDAARPKALVKSSDKIENPKKEPVGYNFFSYEKPQKGIGADCFEKEPQNPVIPGSEIRGAVRSIFEAAFHGCMSTVTEERVLGRRCPEAKEPGILKKMDQGGFKIFPCKRAMLYVEKTDNTRYHKEKDGIKIERAVYDGWNEGQELWIKVSEKGYPKQVNHRTIQLDPVVTDCKPAKKGEKQPKGYIRGWLHKGEAFGGKKHHESVFYIEEKGGKAIEAGERDVESLQEALNEYRNEKKNRMCRKGKEWYQGYQVNEAGTCVYYCRKMEGNETAPAYLSPACIGKEIFHKRVHTLLVKNGSYQPCEKREALCPACSLFGMAAKKKGGRDAAGSRVRFTDAHWVSLKNGQKKFYAPLVLPELGEPKPSAVEFYTFSPYEGKEGEKGYPDSRGYWTYDYMYEKDMCGNVCRNYLPENLPKLRGRKFYWHSDSWKEYIKNQGNIENSMQQRIRPLKEGNVFTFQVYFEGLSSAELERLRWSLDFEDGNCAHKIGHGKPLGFGSARVTIEEMNIRSMDGETGAYLYKTFLAKELPGGINKEEGNSTEAVKKMADFSSRPKNVSYPKVCNSANGNSKMNKKNAEASHQWFSLNKQMTEDTKNMRPAFAKVLPNLEKESEKKKEDPEHLYKIIKNW